MRNLLCAATLIVLALVGCKKASPLVGKWNTQVGAGSLDFEFKPEGTFTIGTKFGQMAMTEKGEYKLDGESLTLTPKDVEAPGLPAAVLAKAKQDPSFGKAQEIKVKFTSDDEISLSGLPKAGGVAGQSVTLKRVKEGA